jgi:hypothetical protein
MLPPTLLIVDSYGLHRLKDCAVSRFVLESNKCYLNLEIDTFVKGYREINAHNMRTLSLFHLKTHLLGNASILQE